MNSRVNEKDAGGVGMGKFARLLPHPGRETTLLVAMETRIHPTV